MTGWPSSIICVLEIMLQGIHRNFSHVAELTVYFPARQSDRNSAGINHRGCVNRVSVTVVQIAVYSRSRTTKLSRKLTLLIGVLSGNRTANQ